MKQDLAYLLDCARHAARLGAHKIHGIYRQYLSGADIGIREKSENDPVTAADMAANQVIAHTLRSYFPEHAILTEEEPNTWDTTSEEWVWMIDPLDGTTNFSVHNPFFAVSISLVYKNQPLLGVIYSPIQDELFTAESNRGANLNNQPITVDEKGTLEDLFLAYGNGRDINSRKQMVEIFGKLKLLNNKVRQVGAAALELCYVASGRFGAFLMPGLNAWDVFAGALIVKEAGGVVTDFQNKPLTLTSSDIIACSPSIHPILLDIINT